MFNFNNETDANDFIKLFFGYISFFGDVQKTKTKIGIVTAKHLHGFLTSFLEENEKLLLKFADAYFKDWEETQ